MIIESNELRFKPNSKSQEDFFKATEDEVLFGGSAGGGKGQPLNAPVLTPKGFVKMGDLKIGSIICSPTGGTTVVKEIHELGERSIWAIVFNDGTVSDFTEDHLWNVKIVKRSTRRISKISFTTPKLIETKEIVKAFRGGTKETRETLNRYVIPTTYPVEYTPVKFHYDPYAFGVMMSKAWMKKSVGAARVTKEQVVKLEEYIRANKANHPELFYRDEISFASIRFMPVETRFQFVRGLLDADTLDKHLGINTVTYNAYKKSIVENLMFILRSLGYVVRYKYSPYMNIYSCTIGGKNIDRIFARESMKRRLHEMNIVGGEPTLYEKEIESVSYRGKQVCRCITVDNPNGLYITKDFIVTHNSLSIVIDPMRYTEHGDYTAIIFRRSFPELEPLINYARKYYLSAGATYHVQSKTFTFPSGATVKFGFMDADGDWANYQGHQYAGMYFDELTNVNWKNVEAIRPWNRSKAMGIQPYWRAATNPGGISHSEVKKYFVDTCPPEKDGEMIFSEEAQMWWQPVVAGETYYDVNPLNGSVRTRKYIPSRVFENKDLLQINPDYINELLRLDPNKRKAYLEGNWDIFEGQFFNMSYEVHGLPPDLPDFDYTGWRVSGGLDYGNRTVLEVTRMDNHGNAVVFAECFVNHTVPSVSAEKIADELLERRLHGIMIRYDTNMDSDMSKYTGYDKTVLTIFKDVFKKKMGRKAPIMIPVSKTSPDKRQYRQFANEAVKEYLHYERNPDGSFAMQPKLKFTRDVVWLWDTMPKLLHDPEKNAGLDFNRKVGISDPYDGFKYGFLPLYRPLELKERRVLSEHEKIMDHIALMQRKSYFAQARKKNFTSY